MNDAIRRIVIFAQHNAVTDEVFNSFQSAVMRNVGRQFNPILRSRVHRVAFESLVPLGFLALGPTNATTSPSGRTNIARRNGTPASIAGHRDAAARGREIRP